MEGEAIARRFRGRQRLVFRCHSRPRAVARRWAAGAHAGTFRTLSACYRSVVGKKINLPLLAGESGAKRSPSDRPRKTDPPKKSDRPGQSARLTKASKKPTLDDARNRLGGRTLDEEPPPPGIGPGSIVNVVALGGAEHAAVVVFANASEVHVLIDGTKLRRVRPAQLATFDGSPPNLLTKISADAQIFGGLSEGLPVRYADDVGGLLGGRLLEKCRYGALVVREDGAVVAVGFRKLWPAATSGAA